MIMCVTIEKPIDSIFALYQQQYDLEVALMHKRMNKLLIKVEKNSAENSLESSYNRFKESLKKNNHENLKK